MLPAALLLPLLLLGCIVAFGLDWPKSATDVLPLEQVLRYDESASGIEAPRLLTGDAPVFRLSAELPSSFMDAWIFDYGRGMAGVLTDGVASGHRFVDTEARRFVSHALVLPDRRDLQAPRFVDVWIDGPPRVSIVTWRNNQVLSTVASIGVEVYDNADAGFESGLYSLEVLYGGRTVATYSFGGLAEDGDGRLILAGLGNARATLNELLNARRQVIGYALSLNIPVQLTPGRGLLQLVVSDVYGNESRVQFVLVVTAPEI